LTDKALIQEKENCIANANTTFRIRFSLEKELARGSLIKFNFPKGFQFHQPQIFYEGFESCEKIEVLIFKHKILCEGFKYGIKDGQWESIAINGIVNPRFSGVYEGFYLEIIEGNSSNVVEKVSLSDKVLIEPGLMKAQVRQSNSFTDQTSFYRFDINLKNGLLMNEELHIQLPPEFTSMDEKCYLQGSFHSKIEMLVLLIFY